ncbi:MAG: hypothetical protein IKN66_14260 [Ruminococcus sp.]|nr:hypothetical protein [Ruminococcus sp.]
MSEKEINELIQTGELAKADPEAEPAAEAEVSAELMEAAQAHADQQIAELKEKSRKRKKSLIKLGAMTLLSVIIFIFTTIAWFTMSREVESGSMAIKSNDANFDITMLSGTDGIFKDIHEQVHEDDAMYWQMTASNNLINYNPYVDQEHPGDQGIHPSSEGVISFNVIPKVDSVTLDFDFEIIGYQASYSDVNNTPNNATDDELVMTPLLELSGGDGVTAQNLLNGHILLFEHRSGTVGNYVYSTPICSNKDMHRIMKKTVTGKDTETQIDIYWVWPNTLSTIVNASTSGISTVPFCVDNDAYHYNSYTAIKENVESYPHYYLKGKSSSDDIDAEDDIGAHYSLYGDMYDQGDNEIGMRVHYLLIKLSVTEGTAGGSGS